MTIVRRSDAMKQINWNVTRADADAIRRIARRAIARAATNGVPIPDNQTLQMDLTAAHLNGCPLDLAKLESFRDSDFGHDVYGIQRFIDRASGALTGCFVPRCARPQPQKKIVLRAAGVEE